MKNSTTQFHFWIGTEAELIKVFPVMKSLEEKQIPFDVVATGQNPVENSSLWQVFKNKPQITMLTSGPAKKTTLSLLVWFFKLLFVSLQKLDSAQTKQSTMFIHGDTISTLAGAVIGFVKRYKVGHIEAGLRSFNYLKPFPEEIDRVISSLFVSYHYCPGDFAAKNLSKKNGEVLNTQHNTLIDSLWIAQNYLANCEAITSGKYFVFVVHRQENLFDLEFLKKIVLFIIEQSKKTPCVFLMHEPTKAALENANLYGIVANTPTIKCIPRQSYFQFMQLLKQSEFLVTDGGSNQEESYYMGLPCLILRTETERDEGLNKNVILEKNDWQVINNFFANYENYRGPVISPDVRPSEIIAQHIEKIYAN